MQLTTSDIDAICGLVNDLCGVYLDESKIYLIESRLGDLVKRSGCANYADLARRVRYATDQSLRNQVIDAITTKETMFFRDVSAFEALQHKVIPDLIDSKAASAFSRRLRVWSAGCSTGQEAYSIAMSLAELVPDIHAWDFHILGTDISDDAIRRASRGWYSTHELGRGLSEQRLERFCRREANGCQVKESLRSLVSFERHNLLKTLPVSRTFDIIFCRNVAIYFTPDARRDLFQRLAMALSPEGYLFVGGQESLIDFGQRFQLHHHCRAVFYRPNLLQTS